MSTELTTITLDAAKYPALVAGGSIGQTIRQNLAGESLTEGDLVRIRVPAGGGKNWIVPTADGGEHSLKELTGVVVYIAARRAYWPDSNPTGEPPACSSRDCITGTGRPGGPCVACPHNTFGSAQRPDGTVGRGKACKESRLVFLLREGRTLPDVVVIPPGSLKSFKAWRLLLDVPFWGIVTSLTLRPDKNKDGVTYSQVVTRQAGVLSEETAKGIAHYAQELQGLFEAIEVEAEELEA